MFNAAKLNDLNLNNYYTKKECDYIFAKNSVIYPDVEAITTHLDTLDQVVIDQNSDITTLQTDLYDPLKTSGMTSINNLSGLTTLVNNAINAPTPLNLMANDPFFGVINMNTSLATILDFAFVNMPNHTFNIVSSLTGLRNIAYGKISLVQPVKPTTETNKTEIMQSTTRYFDFSLTFNQFTSLSYANILHIFVPDTVYNKYDGRIYKLNKVMTYPTASFFNSFTCCSYMYLYIRNHIQFNPALVANLFTSGAGTFLDTRLNLVLLKPIMNYGAVEILPATKSIFKVYYIIQSKRMFDFMQLIHKSSYPLIPNVNMTVPLSLCYTTAATNKAVVDVYLPNTMCSLYSVSGTWSTYISGTSNVIVEDSDTNQFEMYLMALSNMG